MEPTPELQTLARIRPCALRASMDSISGLLDPCQRCASECQREQRGHAFYCGLEDAPPLYGAEDCPAPAKLIYAHFVSDDRHWYIAEFDPGSWTGYGYITPCGPLSGAWAYFNLRELESSVLSADGRPVERDLTWTTKPMVEIEGTGIDWEQA